MLTIFEVQEPHVVEGERSAFVSPVKHNNVFVDVAHSWICAMARIRFAVDHLPGLCLVVELEAIAKIRPPAGNVRARLGPVRIKTAPNDLESESHLKPWI